VSLRRMQSADRIVIGALRAWDESGQRESMATYLEAVQELRVALQRLEGFLVQRLSRPELKNTEFHSMRGVAVVQPLPAEALSTREELGAIDEKRADPECGEHQEQPRRH